MCKRNWAPAVIISVQGLCEDYVSRRLTLIEKICLSFSQARSSVVLSDHADRGPCLQGPACADPGEVAGPVVGNFAERV